MSNGRPNAPRVEEFLFIGRGLTAGEFTEYVQQYDFGALPPDFVVLHHTAIPSTLAAPYPAGVKWDAGEAGLDEAAIKRQRHGRLVDIRRYYRAGLGWDRGPHLFVDDRWIWLFTPMFHPGIHAMWGNQFRDTEGRPHYSIGIEVVGYYEQTRWPPEVARLVGHAVAVLKRRLGTFDLRYLYPAPESKPGRRVIGIDAGGRSIWACAHPDRLRWGGISSHRDYNKPECPGAAITEAFYIKALDEGWRRLVEPDTPPAPGVYIARGDAVNIRQGPGIGFPIALDGTARVPPAGRVVIDSVSAGPGPAGTGWWGHLAGGVGFVWLDYFMAGG